MKPRVNGYELIRQIAVGGMGNIWLSKHELLDRWVAIKFDNQDTSVDSNTPGHRTRRLRFVREAIITSGLRSPNTVRLFDFGTTDDGVYYYVMEYLDGLDLMQIVSRFGPLSPARTVHLLVQLCAALAEVHARGLIHRDIKPSNIFACRVGLDHDVTKLIDFGLVKLAAPKSPRARRTTAVAQGTPAYMSPENASAIGCDHRADIYSIGCVAYRLLSGRDVFEAPKPADVMMKQVRAAPTRLSLRTSQSVPPALETLVMRCLEKNPDHRVQTVLELKNALETIPLAVPWSSALAVSWWREAARTGGSYPPAPLSSRDVKVIRAGQARAE